MGGWRERTREKERKRERERKSATERYVFNRAFITHETEARGGDSDSVVVYLPEKFVGTACCCV